MKNILCFGDSNTWGNDASTYDPAYDSGKRFPFDVRWPGRLQTLLGDGYRIIEDALNGRTVMVDDPYMPNRKGMDHLKTALDAQAPLDLVILALGCNEYKDMFNLSAGMIAYGLELMVKEIQQSFYGYPAPKILLLAPSPVPDAIADGMFGVNFGLRSAKVSREIGAYCKDVADRYGCAFLDCADLGLELNDADYLHYSAADHAKVAETIAPIVRKLIG